MPIQLRVLSLNCWGVLFLSSDIPERFQAISEELRSGKYDLVSLQEVWIQDMYKKLVSQTEDALPYHHYFYSGLFGSGVCVFSKYPIVDVDQHVFSVYGASVATNTERFTGKSVGLCRIQHPDAEINFYAAHTHAPYAEYASSADHKYTTTRAGQAFELSQFVRHTSKSADVNILAGDLNNQPSELGLAIIQSNTGMDDAWLTAEHKNPGDTGVTCDSQDNIYTYSGRSTQRCDYILYKGTDQCRVKCVHCETTLHKVPGKPFNYSDHEGLLAHLELEKNKEAGDVKPDPPDVSRRDASLREAVLMIEEQISSTASNRLYYMAILLFCVFLMILASWLPLPDILSKLLHLLLGIVTAWSVWMGVVVMETEKRGLLATKVAMEVLINTSGTKLD